MKKLIGYSVVMITVVMMCAVLVGAVNAQEDTSNYYALVGEVVVIDTVKDEVTVQDFNGNLWVFTGCEDWIIGDSCGMVMDTMNTPVIYDDEILSVKYQGWMLEDWR